MPLSDAPFPRFWRGAAQCVVLFVLLLLGAAIPLKSHAQREPGSVTIGFEIGHLGGATAKLYRPDGVSYSTLLTTDGDDFAALYLHRLWERPVSDSLVHIYYGPGLYGRGQQLDVTPTVETGVSGQIGLNFYNERFEVFLHATPILRLHPSLTPRLAGSVGLRYDLFQPDG
ncbi:hypothetical protein BSZ35_13735 [Salinibacter sp. 10B]|uniref:RNA polymerase subunit sigma-54 n=1 Tax=Salinibacter sp. 10B TaxID=1923971 RepID=UPI000CF4C04F|nr:RNA polymerase subunit sigma-54 [Salinibacter sp. 10B]PQJ35524.1 hypothetical protein BSZ35_13735 [Salinibacter sp. 10B]